MRHHRPHQSLFALLPLILIASATEVWALDPEKLFEKVSPSIVVVVAVDSNGKPVSQGSGVVVAPKEVTTNCHVLEHGTRYQVKQGNQAWPATLLRGNADYDLCVLSAPSLTAPSASLRGVKGIKVGARVYAIGAPRGLELTLSEGLVSSLRPMGNSQIIQTNAAISPGSSGGGLFDADGRLIGITTFYLAEGQNLNFALPADWIAVLPKVAAPAKKTGRRTMDWLAGAAALTEKQNWTGLLTHARRWVKAEPGNALAHVMLGFAYDSLKQYAQAVEAYRKALRINPEFAVVWQDTGLAYIKLGQYLKAVEAYREALRINPENAETWSGLGFAYSSIKQHIQAVEAYQTALRFAPEYAEAWNGLGGVYEELNQYSQAVEAYREALRVNPVDAGAWHNLGNIHGNLNQHPQAVEAYREALRLNPNAYYTWSSLGNTYLVLGQRDQALEAFRTALRLKPEDAGVHYSLGRAYILLGQRDQALEAYKQLRRLDRAMADQLFNLIVPAGQ